MTAIQLTGGRAATIAALIAAAAIGGCRTVASSSASVPSPEGPRRVVSDRLFFGRSIPGGGMVSDAEWTGFVDSVITPRFPNGLTIWRAEGQWREATGTLARESVMVLEVLYPADSASDRAVREIAEEYKRRFRQEAVLRTTDDALLRLLD